MYSSLQISHSQVQPCLIKPMHQRCALVTLGGNSKGCEEKPVGLML